MSKTPAYAAPSAGQPLEPFAFERREPGPHDVKLDVLYCGVCHSDIHQARGEWGRARFPMVPGHEIVGRVTQVGASVTRFKVGDLAGVGCMVDSCRECEPCRDDTEQFCEKGAAFTYNSTEMDRKTPTYGGYSTETVVSERFAVKVPAGLDLAGAAPLLCAGITTYSPLRQWNCKKGDRVAVVGLGGLGHMAVKFAVSMGAEVTVLSTSRAKEEDARRMGASGFEVTRETGIFRRLSGKYDLIIDTLSVTHDLNQYLGLLRPNGALVLVGMPPEAVPVSAFSLVPGNRKLAGSNIGGIAETQRMLDYCAEHRIVSDVEVIPIQHINEAYERMLRGDVRYRFVIDLASLKQAAAS
ncbi:NAD(P)-dependent alcohol dehydrogenase [Myxococcaceae bacterium GXIMD 01537]